MIQADLNIILPEILLSVYAMAALIFAVYTGKDKLAPMLVWLTAALFGAMAAVDRDRPGEAGRNVAFGGMFIDDGFARFRQDHDPAERRLPCWSWVRNTWPAARHPAASNTRCWSRSPLSA